MKFTAVSASTTGSSLLITFKKCTVLFDCGLELLTTNEVGYKLPAFDSVDLSAVDVLLISNYLNITALPFLTEYMQFKGRIYATLPSVQFGRILCEDIIRDHGARQDQNAGGESKVFHDDKLRITRWFSKEDIKKSFDSVRTCSFGQRIMLYNGVEMMAASSGACMGGANWILETPFEKLVLMANSASSILTNASMSRHYHAQEMDIHPIKNADVLIASPSLLRHILSRSAAFDYSSQLKKFCETITHITQVSGGHVIVPCRPTPLILDLFGVLYLFFTNAAESANAGGRTNFPTFIMVSPQSKALVATADVDTEWLPAERQERSYHPDEPFFSNELISMGKLKLFGSIHEDSFRANLSDALSATAIGSSASLSPLVIFIGQNDMQKGEVAHLIEFFRQDPRCGVVAIDPDLSGSVGDLFKPYRKDDTKIQLFETFLDPRLDLNAASSLISSQLTPRRVVAPPALIQALNSNVTSMNPLEDVSPSRISFVEGDRIGLKLNRPLERALMDHHLAKTIQPRSLGSLHAISDSSSVVASITAKVTKRDGKMILSLPSSSAASPGAQQLPKHLWGTISLEQLLAALTKRFGEPRVRLDGSASILISDDAGSTVVAQVTAHGDKTHISSSDSSLRRSIAQEVAKLSL